MSTAQTRAHKRQTARISRLEDGIREALDRLRLSPGVAEITTRLREVLEDD